jgi:hypothetical protein
MIPWLFAMPIFGQVSETSLRDLYGKPNTGRYIVRPGVTVATSDGPNGEICVLTISGPIAEQELTAIIDEAVPTASRGLALGRMVDCVGACLSVRRYEKLTISSAVMGGQIADPAAIITSNSKNCEQRAKDARAKGFSMTRPNTQSK